MTLARSACVTLAASLLAVSCTGAPVPRALPTPSPSPLPGRFGGVNVKWPTIAPKRPNAGALGAVLTTARVRFLEGGAAPAGLLLPRVGGTDVAPVVLTSCERRATLQPGGFTLVPPARAGEVVVVLDPGHGGRDSGARAPNGTREADRVLGLAFLVRDALVGRVDRVYLTRSIDQEVSLRTRVVLADALGATLAVSVHLNAARLARAIRPGVMTFASAADPNGRRAAGVLYQFERAYIDTLRSRIRGRWSSDPDAGALYRLGSRGDYYFQLRESRVTWVISESMFISNPAEAALLEQPVVRQGLASAIADGIVAYAKTNTLGSGWRHPVRRGDPNATTPLCTDPPA